MVTLETFHVLRGWLKAKAVINNPVISVTFVVVQLLIFWLKRSALLNVYDKSVTVEGICVGTVVNFLASLKP